MATARAAQSKQQAQAIKYTIDYQYMPKGSSRPHDDGEIITIEATDKEGFAVIPNVGDFVATDNSSDGGERANLQGKVKSRIFHYTRLSDNTISCHVNIVVAETDDDWGKLLKC